MMIGNLALPRWTYVPGRGGGPDRDTLDAVKVSVPPRFDRVVPADHPALIYGLTLNDKNFFWECHEILEAIWKAAQQGGRDKILLRACIQIANANLKQAMGQPHAAARLFAGALAELDELSVRQTNCDGIAAFYPAAALAAVLRARLANPAATEAVMLNSHS